MSEAHPSNPYAPGTSAEGLAPAEHRPDEASVTFLLDAGDYIAFHNRVYRRGFRRFLWLLIFAMLGGLWILAVLDPGQANGAGAVIPYQTLLVLTAVLLATPLLSPLLVRRQLRRYYEHITRTMTVTLSRSGLRVHSDVSDLHYRWHGVSQVNITPQHIFIQINRYQSFIVPRRAFPDPPGDRHFRELLLEFHSGQQP